MKQNWSNQRKSLSVQMWDRWSSERCCWRDCCDHKTWGSLTQSFTGRKGNLLVAMAQVDNPGLFWRHWMHQGSLTPKDEIKIHTCVMPRYLIDLVSLKENIWICNTLSPPYLFTDIHWSCKVFIIYLNLYTSRTDLFF